MCVEKRLNQALCLSGFADSTFGVEGRTSPHCLIVAEQVFKPDGSWWAEDEDAMT